MPKFSKRSQERLDTCDKQLQRLFNEVIKHYDCTILEGARPKDRQNELFRQGKSKLTWPNSKHNLTHFNQLSQAVDVVPYPIDWNDWNRFYHFAGFVKGVAASMGIKIRCGVDWDGDNDFKDQSFHDAPHFEIVEA